MHLLSNMNAGKSVQNCQVAAGEMSQWTKQYNFFPVYRQIILILHDQPLHGCNRAFVIPGMMHEKQQIN